MDFGAKPISICLVMLDNPGVLNTMFSLGKANNFSTKENRCEDCLMLVTKYSMYATWGACSRVWSMFMFLAGKGIWHIKGNTSSK